MAEITNRNKWIFDQCSSGKFIDKERIKRQLITSMLNKTLKMFNYKNLPDSIPQKDLEIQLQINGFAIIKEVNGKLYSFIGGLGGEPNPYYLPTIAVIANPALRYNKSLKIDEECVVILNDYLYQGLSAINDKYSSLLTEAIISLKYALINNRIPALVTADNDTGCESAKTFFQKIVNGEDYEVISTKAFVDGLKAYPFSVQSNIKDIIESIQYIKGSWLNELGINATFNMKREAINEAECCVNDDVLFPSIETMLQCRKDGLKKVNEMYGTNIEVELSSVWKRHIDKDNLEIQLKESEIKENENNETERPIDE